MKKITTIILVVLITTACTWKQALIGALGAGALAGGVYACSQSKSCRNLDAPASKSTYVRCGVNPCKICNIGKACGNSCISQSYECYQPVGCACDGY